jgi:hypothetical protein
MGWLITAGVIIGLCFLPVGIYAAYNSAGVSARLTLWLASFSLYPRPKKEKREDSARKSQNQKGTSKDKTPGKVADFRPLVEIILSLLAEFRHRICVKELEMKLTLAGGDPADLAIHYGQAWTLLGNLVPQLDRYFRIKKRDLGVNLDFTADEPMFYGHIHITITLGRLLFMVIYYGRQCLREYRRIMNLRKGGSKL